MGEWIGVKDRLPEIGQKTLCRVNIWHLRTMFDEGLEGPEWSGEYIGQGTWDFQSDTDNAYYEVTHWKPIAEPPKE